MEVIGMDLKCLFGKRKQLWASMMAFLQKFFLQISNYSKQFHNGPWDMTKM